jgi:putative hydrolase of the HAD superfamily
MMEVMSFAEIIFQDKVPKLICFDAVGTLFGVRGSVGEIYCQIAREYGVNGDVELINTHFYQSFKNAPPCAFPDVPPAEVPHHEYQWWLNVNRVTFTNAGLIDRFDDFAAFFARLYAYFTTADAWYLYPDVIPSLTKWKSQGITLAIVSNFDSRLYKVLDNLNLTEYFNSITISTTTGVAKPAPQIFINALQQYDFTPQDVWHIGDSWNDDIVGAKSVNINPVWIKRN